MNLTCTSVDIGCVKMLDENRLDEKRQKLILKEASPRLLQLKLHYFVLIAAGSLVFFVLTSISVSLGCILVCRRRLKHVQVHRIQVNLRSFKTFPSRRKRVRSCGLTTRTRTFSPTSPRVVEALPSRTNHLPRLHSGF